VQVISPNNDVVSANVAHTSSAAFATDVAKWTLSTTYGRLDRAALNVKDYGAIGDGSHDDTIAIQSIVTLIAGLALAARPSVYFPAGSYKITAPITGIPESLRLLGAGVNNTVLMFAATGDQTMFSLGTYSATPSNYWNGAQDEFTLTDMTVETATIGYSYEGSRSHTCIQDNGCGGVSLLRVNLAGFKRCFWAPYGSDFSTVTASKIQYNDVGVYLGPGSQQVQIRSTMFFGNRESLVVEGAPQGSAYGNQFIDSSVADVVFEYNTTTRGGIPAGIANEMSWGFYDTWLESYADPGTARVSPRRIWITGAVGSVPRYVSFYNTRLVLGGATNGTRPVVQIDTGTRFSMENTLVEGDAYTYLIYTASGTFPTVSQKNTRTVDGYTAITKFGGSTINCHYYDSMGSLGGWEARGGATGLMSLYPSMITDNNGVSFTPDGTGALQLAVNSGGTWYNRITLDVNNSKIMFPGTSAQISSPASNVLAAGTGNAWRTGAVATSSRPTSHTEGDSVWDSTLHKQIWWNGSNWIDGTGATV
jgi:hypothetical protein